MNFMVLALSLIGYLTTISARLGLRMSVAVFVYISFVIASLYFFGIFGCLYQGVIAVTAFGLILLVFGIREIASKLKRVQLKIYVVLCVGFYVFPYAVIYTLIPDDFLFTGWDEFSHWAISIKFIYENDSLYTSDSPLAFKHYPPAQQLFQYYFISFFGWSEKNVLFAQGFFVQSAIMCVTGIFFRRISILAVSTYFALCVSIYYFSYDYSHIYVDPLLSAVFAICLAFSIINFSSRSAICLALSLCVLVLLKQVGLILAIVAIAVCVANSIGRVGYNYIILRDKNNRNILYRNAIFVSGILIFVFLVYYSWGWYLAIVNSSQSLVIPNAVDIFQQPLLGRFGMIVVEFINRIHSEKFFIIGSPLNRLSYSQIFDIFSSVSPAKFLWIIYNEIEYSALSIGFSVIDLSLFMIMLSVFAVVLLKRETKIMISIFFIIGFGCVGYLFFLLFSYLLFFSLNEAVALASFERYAATYYLSWFIVVVSIGFSAVDTHKGHLSKFVSIVICVLFIAYAPPQFFRDLRGIIPPSQLLDTRRRVDAIANVAKSNMVYGDRAYFFSQNSSGFEKYIFNYSMLPFHSSWWCWSIGKKYSPEDMWTCDSKFLDLVRGYNIIVLYSGDSEFWSNVNSGLGTSFLLKQSGLFKVNYVGDNVVGVKEIK